MKRKQLSPLRHEQQDKHMAQTQCHNCKGCCTRQNEVTGNDMLWCKTQNMRILNPQNAIYCRHFDDKRIHI